MYHLQVCYTVHLKVARTALVLAYNERTHFAPALILTLPSGYLPVHFWLYRLFEMGGVLISLVPTWVGNIFQFMKLSVVFLKSNRFQETAPQVPKTTFGQTNSLPEKNLAATLLLPVISMSKMLRYMAFYLWFFSY